MSRIHTIINRPVQTEKSVGKTVAPGTYTFIVRDDATKSEVKNAVEKYYGAKVKSVRTLVTHHKIRVSGRKPTIKRRTEKKAIVTTVGAKTIDFNKITVKA